MDYDKALLHENETHNRSNEHERMGRPAKFLRVSCVAHGRETIPFPMMPRYR